MTKITISDTLSKLESSYDAAEVFKYKNTTSWINVKNYLYAKSLVGNFEEESKLNFFCRNGIYLFILSILNYLKLFFGRGRKDLYVGAGSGLFEHNHETLDSYLPYKENADSDRVYMLSAEHPDKLIEHLPYLKMNNVVIYSFLLAPLKAIFTKLLYKYSKLNVEPSIFEELEASGVKVTLSELSYIHTRFIVSYHLYKLFLFPLNVKRAHIVSAYSNSEIIAVLKEKNIKAVELQHGLIGTTHRAYNYQCSSKLLPTPDEVFVYNEFWKQELLNAGYYADSQVRITGRLKYDLVEHELGVHNKDFIVFTGQGGFYEEIVSLFKTSNEYLKSNNIDLLYIPHPNESKDSIAFLQRSSEGLDSISIISDKKYTTEQYIFNSLYHISVYSSCHFDSIHYKKITYVFDVMNNNPMQYYFDAFPEQYKAIKSIADINPT